MILKTASETPSKPVLSRSFARYDVLDAIYVCKHMYNPSSHCCGGRKWQATSSSATAPSNTPDTYSKKNSKRKTPQLLPLLLGVAVGETARCVQRPSSISGHYDSMIHHLRHHSSRRRKSHRHFRKLGRDEVPSQIVRARRRCPATATMVPPTCFKKYRRDKVDPGDLWFGRRLFIIY